MSWKTSRFFSLCLLLSLLTACQVKNQNLTILVSSEEPAHTIAEQLVKLFDAIGYRTVIEEKPNTDEILLAIENGDGNLAVVEEPDRMAGALTTIAPLYPSVLHVLYRDSENPQSFPDLLRGKNVYAGTPGSVGRRLLADLRIDFGLGLDEYTVHDDPWSVDPDVWFIFGGLLEDSAVQRLKGYKLFSFGDTKDLGSGTLAEGIALVYPNVNTFVLPESVYQPLSDEAVLTLSTRSVLLASPDLDEEIAYDLIQYLIEHSQELAVHYNFVSQVLNSDFDPASLIQPLHPGARRFLDRDKPGFLERYSEILALAVTVLALLISSSLAILRFAKQRKKDRVDVYYRKILDLRQRIHGDLDNESLKQIAEEVKHVQEEVFALLIDERVDADATLTIFLDLSNQVLKELEPRIA